MTKEEIEFEIVNLENEIAELEDQIDVYKGMLKEIESKETIKALKCEACEDCVSRQAAIEAVKQAVYNHDSAIMRITELPPVTPVEKTKAESEA